jgi:hypothetical protein
MSTALKVTLDLDELAKALEPLIRRIIREEISRLTPQIFHLTPEMPLYEDLEDISLRKVSDKIELYSHNEVWDE